MMFIKDIRAKITSEFDISQNGIQIIEDEKRIEIYNDPFRTVPLFITRRISDNEIILFSRFEDFYSLKDIDRTIDEVGFWEIVIFGMALWTRTLYKSVEQMPGAAKIIIDKQANTYNIERYWNFNVELDSRINSMEKAAKGLYEKIDSIFSKLDRTKKYVMGMSGGLDSRITLAFLSRYIPKDNLELFTYGFDGNILEYQYAKDIANALGFNQPKFHKLTAGSYKKAFEFLPKKSGGQISIGHCHIMDCIKSNQDNFKEKIQISTYYTDAIFGWSCVAPKKYETAKNSDFFRTLKNSVVIDSSIKHEIAKDIQKVFFAYESKHNYSRVDEYKYVSERNQKFHIYMAFIQKQFMQVILPYANFELLRYSISVPIEYRANKNIVEYIINNYFRNISSRDFRNISSRDFRNISSRFQWGSQLSSQLEWYYFKLLNYTNAFLRLATNGYVQFFNKYQTEDQERLLYTDFKTDLQEATKILVEKGIFHTATKEYYDKLPLRGGSGVSERYNLMSLARLI
ncbi:MAG: hypothetical protein KKD29_01550 [Candidatus Omnitrophica bacterium]|nr:hypothetical protein [Candidatus Omnitrophota bacterium]